MPIVIGVGIGGALGSMLRYLLAVAITSRMRGDFPLATLAINVVGSFALGALIAVSMRVGVSPLLLASLSTGVLGGFTTFSTFTLDAMRLFGNGDAATALVYLAASVAGGLLAAAAGVAVVTRLGW